MSVNSRSTATLPADAESPWLESDAVSATGVSSGGRGSMAALAFVVSLSFSVVLCLAAALATRTVQAWLNPKAFFGAAWRSQGVGGTNKDAAERGQSTTTPVEARYAREEYLFH
ncbi:hypothetical protein IscW_ISCW009559 [Ixodes scapularis]|uniref:Uncharacterized protein n=1 Tax=Ixodes scapularis TaxID=6945 RepID=B7Q128_IXOSC|nr:hypothetical protein IscW_ISCW009559 [Ixodes scapularis]|eukprot:XP_002408879.1 hypothetical protein IscW_ISCW009559 [Ixodes scapularis]